MPYQLPKSGLSVGTAQIAPRTLTVCRAFWPRGVAT